MESVVIYDSMFAYKNRPSSAPSQLTTQYSQPFTLLHYPYIIQYPLQPIEMPHTPISPAILYFGTPVAILSSENEDGTSNLAPMSSVWWLGHRCMLGLDASSKTPQNILRTKECVINLPSSDMVDHVNALALTTGSDPVSASKQERNYEFVKDKWTRANLTPLPSSLIQPHRILECPVQMECELTMTHPMLQDLFGTSGPLYALEMRVVKIWVRDELRMDWYDNRIDPDKWQPMIMSFQELYGLEGRKLGLSKLGGVREEKYRGLAEVDDVKTAEKFGADALA
ncbi:uncharacterized protein N0V89_006784 [Didymosphaeria variabile]|uniref:Flavin reductase like domain-containing protein n=1 Tax=Didymosphaeria variabile TaxID=1932322 RepID=A0A9W8XIA8_9PLEO|nr:uncharacterized protein N0V89_006784 [Didymosphaeria variabile]KAJ4351442.1 hypothetical protein N0V89_006784 [Didymosphaeria variabile]